MNVKVLKLAVAGGLLISGALAAEPLRDLQFRLNALRSDQPIKAKVDVELKHRGAAPLHLNDTKERGRVLVLFGPRGVEVREQKRTGSFSHFSVWQSSDPAAPEEAETPLIGYNEARDLIDPAGMIGTLLSESTLVDDQAVTWEGQQARLLVVRPTQLPAELEAEKVSTAGQPKPIIAEAKIWLGADGLPLALERTQAIRFPPALKVTQQQTLTFQQVGGRLLVRRSTETFSGTALTALRGADTKKVKVTVD